MDYGSKDRSWELLSRIQTQDPHVRLVRFNRNYGQHMAIFAGFEQVQGEVVVTLDADLQNPPEEGPKLAEGYDVVSGWRQNRHPTRPGGGA